MSQAILRCLFGGLIAAICLGCAPRGQLTTLPPGRSSADGATVHEVLVATTRAETDNGQVYANERGDETLFSRFLVSVPPARELGSINWPTRTPNPETDFFVEKADRLTSATAFDRSLDRSLRERPAAERNAVIFVHGYNTNFAEALYRFTQAHHDYRSADIPILFSWGSSASTVGYLYDRDSTLVARNALVELLKTVHGSGARKIAVIAHSMGTFLLMEALREIAISGDRSALSRISEVVLMSPDISVDVFESQARAIGDLPQPFVVILSEADRALRVSSQLSQQSNRLGTLEDPRRLSEFEITLVDITALAEIRSLNHLGAIESAVQIERIRALAAFSDFLDEDAQEAAGSHVVQTFNRTIEITLQP
ncbi:alpha/beta hydrolase [Tropicimonas sp. S265A]|uniref:alpha/beta hydrolase n=1 Tax=Tropicimonas sp. S265A TaxID=3415134 RepID=UPI003C7D1B34